MSKRFLGLLLPFLLVYGIDDLDLDGLDLPRDKQEQEAKSEEKKPDEVEKVVVPLSEAKEAEEGKENLDDTPANKSEQNSQKEVLQDALGNGAQQQLDKKEEGKNSQQAENPQLGVQSEQNAANQPNAPSVSTQANPAVESQHDEAVVPEELQMQNQEIPAPAPQPKEDELPEGFGPEDLPPEALDGVGNAPSPAAVPTNPTDATPVPNQDFNASASATTQNATPPAGTTTQPKVQLEENPKQGDKKQDGKEVTFAQEDFFELDEDDFMLEKRKGYYVLKVLSLDLEAFVNGKSYNEKNQVQTFGVNGNYTQITSHDGKIQEYKFFQKADKKNTILSRVKIPLKKLDFDSYKLVMKDTPSFFDITNCKVGIKKELHATLNQNKEVIIDLDVRRELRNTTKFKLFLDCPR